MLSILLLGIIVLTFIVQLTYHQFTSIFIFAPTLAFSEPWRFVTSIFLHGGFIHLFFNGYALLLFGSILEKRINQKRFLILFFASGIIGSLIYLLTIYIGIAPSIPALGASGAIYGILGAVAIFTPNLLIYFWFFPMRMKHAVILWVVIEFIGTFNVNSGIASAAHLSGLLFGLAYAHYIKKKESTSTFNW